jgi:ligand-binding sensor domain-containing protein
VRPPGLLGIGLLVLGLLPFAGDRARAQCDESADWTLYSPTGDVAEILMRENIAWVGADGGIIRIDVSQIAGGNPEQRKITDREGLISTDISCLAEDAFGNVWVGTTDSGISIFDSAGNHLTDLSSFNELWSDLVTAMGASGNRMFVVSVDQINAQGSPEGGGFVIITVERDDEGGFRFTPGAVTPPLEVGRAVLGVGDTIWFGTSGQGLWRRDESVQPADFGVALTQADGLASNNVKKLASAPHPDFPGQVLWMGTGSGLQVWDGTTLASLTDFDGHNVLDLFHRGDTMYVLTEEAGDVRRLFILDLSSSPIGLEIVPRTGTCLPDTSYIPREIAVDTGGRIVVGTRRLAFAVWDSADSTWSCPPPLGPHAPQVADIALSSDGILYFGTGSLGTDTNPGNGLGIFRDGTWSSVTEDDDILHNEVVHVEVWPDTTVWFGTAVSREFGGVNRYFPRTGSLDQYTNTAENASRRTQGKNVAAMHLDSEDNLWIAYGQIEGGMSIIEYPSLEVSNFGIEQLIDGANPLLTDFAFDSRGRAWITTRNTTNRPGQVYVMDVAGTPSAKGDDRYTSFLLASEIGDLGEAWDIEIDSSDQIWLVGQNGIILGQIGPDIGAGASATWTFLDPSASQLGGRNPLPYLVATFDWDQHVWLGTESSGLVRVSPDAQTWRWYDQLEGCPLPDQSITGLEVDRTGRTVYVGTLTGGIARLNLSAIRTEGGDRLDPQAFPNPYRPDHDGPLSFAALAPDERATLRIYTITGELVYEGENLAGTKTWDGRNLGSQIVESGVYVITAVTASGEIYEGKVAVLR